MSVRIYHGEAIETLATLEAESIDAVITDPPYELGFMGRAWDGSGIAYNVDLWKQCFRVLRPGGHLLAFGGTRTSHRLTCAIEDAEFEIRDSIAWLYGSGFPKSLDVSKAIDKQRDDRVDVLRVTAEIARLRDVCGLSNGDLDALFGFSGMAGHWTSAKSQPAVPTVAQWAVLRQQLAADAWLDDEVWRLNGRKGTPGEAWMSADVLAIDERWNEPSGVVNVGQGDRERVSRAIKAPATDDAKRWAGWGTALKPAHEPIVVARKPLVGTVAANVLAHGTGALNIEACRVEAVGRPLRESSNRASVSTFGDGLNGSRATGTTDAGRWPTNVVLDELAAAELDEQSGTLKSGANPTRRGSDGVRDAYREFAGQAECTPARGADSGGASRFFPVFKYQAKAPPRERPKVDGVAHATVKPLELMRWLVRLITPRGGVVLDPFAGSGTTAEACVLEGMRCIAIEREADYLPLIAARMARVGLGPTS